MIQRPCVNGSTDLRFQNDSNGGGACIAPRADVGGVAC